MVQINYDLESFQQCKLSYIVTGTDNLDHAAVANEFGSKRYGTLPCCADEISQNIQKK